MPLKHDRCQRETPRKEADFIKIQYKITIIIIALVSVIIISSNFGFKYFFSGYLEAQEQAQINAIGRSLDSFFSEKSNKLQANVSDYAHWDDTYQFIKDGNQAYIDNNLISDTFVNTESNFIILVSNEGIIQYKKYYDLSNGQFAEFPETIRKDVDRVIGDSKSKEYQSGIYKLGNQYYFVAKSEITDSIKEKEPIGRMLFCRQIDDIMIANLNEITESTIAFSMPGNSGEELLQAPPDQTMDDHFLYRLEVQKTEQMLLVKYIIPGNSPKSPTVLLTLTKKRDLFLSGINRINGFLVFYTIILSIILVVVFTLLGLFISIPFKRLIREVRGLDLSRKEVEKLEVHGKDEFAFLRSSVNQLLGRIESEQSKVLENEERLRATLTSVGDGVIAVDKYSLIAFINPVALKLTGWEQEEAYGKPFETVFRIVNEQTREHVESPIQKVFESEKTVELANHTVLIAKDGSEIPVEDTAAPIKDKLGHVIGVVLVFRDCSEQKERRKEIEFLSYHDHLTQLYNRRFFEEEIRRIDTSRNLPLSFLFADVNGLKTINDAFGHEYGDHMIKEVSKVLKAELRTDDIISRTGGDEFIILLPKTDLAMAENLANRLREKIGQKSIMDINISISFGWDTKQDPGQSVWDVLKNAEDIMYQKKIFDNASKRSAVIKSIINILYMKSPREDAHSKRVSKLCEAMGKTYGLSADEVNELRSAGELHDIGKIAIDESILNKADRLSKTEWVQMHRHPEIGYRLLGTSGEFYNIADIVLAHHEKWDGTGYPNQLKGEEIQWKARVIALADAYDAMTNERAYRSAYSREEAIAEIKKHAGTQFDPDIVKVFIEMIQGEESSNIKRESAIHPLSASTVPPSVH